MHIKNFLFYITSIYSQDTQLTTTFPTSNIVSGYIPTVESPWLAYLQGTQICSGFAVNPNTILTSAHCFVEENTSVHLTSAKHLAVWGVVVGLDNVSAQKNFKSSSRAIAKVTIHPCFNWNDPSNYGDIAVVTLKDPIMEGEIPQYPTLRYTTSVPASFNVAGFGYQISGDKNSSGLLKEVNVQKIVSAKCKPYISSKIIDSNFHVCAVGSSGQDSCSGDSGGPMFIRNKITQKAEIFGSVSFGSEEGCGKMGVYINFQFFQAWLTGTLAGRNLSNWTCSDWRNLAGKEAKYLQTASTIERKVTAMKTNYTMKIQLTSKKVKTNTSGENSLSSFVAFSTILASIVVLLIN